MFEVLIGVRDTLRDVVAGFEPGCYRGPDAARLVEIFADVEKLAAAGKVLAARRVEETNLWRSQGFRSAAHWAATKTGTSVGQAVGALQTARSLEDLPETAEAFRSGRLSESQAREVTAAATVHPEAEAALLEAAGTRTMAELRDECRRVRNTGPEAEDAYERIHRSRYLRHWSDRDGAVRLDARLTPDDGARLLAAITPRQRRLTAEGHAAGRREPAEAYAADALVELARGEGGPVAMVQVRVDRDAFLRGFTEGDEVCELPGIGPIPVSAARRLADDAVLRTFVSDGIDVTAVAHPGRTISAHLRSALEARDPVCVVPGCNASTGLEIDHVTPYAEGGATRLDNLARLCAWHHLQKSHRGWVLGGRPGQWTWTRAEEAAQDDDVLDFPP